MAALQCDICGGKLMGRPGGIFECDSCGMQYDTAWAKEKIQEIKGTVKVEGTVEVQGTVKIDGPVEVKGSANADSLLQRAKMALEDGETETAEDYYEQVLSMDPKCPEAYFGLAMIDNGVLDLEELVNTGDWENRNFCRGIQFADSALKKQIQDWKKDFREREEKKAAEEKAWREKRGAELRPLRERFREASRMFSAGQCHTVAVAADSTVMAVGGKYSFSRCIGVNCWNDMPGRMKNVVSVSAGEERTAALLADGTVVGTDLYRGVSEWKNITEISLGGTMIVGLKSDGTVVAAGDNGKGQCAVSGWRDIIAISAGYDRTVGLKKDGTVVTTEKSSYYTERISQWKEIVAVATGGDYILGVQLDGTVKIVGGTYSICDQVEEWTDIVAVSIDRCYEHAKDICGLRSDGTVVQAKYGTKDAANWNDIVAISVGHYYTVGLKSDGTLVTAGSTDYGKCNVRGWKLFDNIDNLREERETHNEARRLKKYQRACNLLEEKESLKELREAEKIFRELGDYRDCEEQLRKYREIYPIVEKNIKYQTACKTMNLSNIIKLEAAKKQFDELGDWKDSRDKAHLCENRIRIFREIEKLTTNKKGLEIERSGLGIFAGKRKKELDSEIQKISKEIEKLEKEA